VVAYLALFVALGGGAWAATSLIGSDGQIHACVDAKGHLRLVKAGASCGTGTTRVAWNQQGPQGDHGSRGDRGPKGDTGPQGNQGPAGAAPSGVFGDGSDGNQAVSADTTLSRDTYYRDLTVAPGVTLDPGGFRILVSGTLTLGQGAAIARDGMASDGFNFGIGLTAGTLGGSAIGGGGKTTAYDPGSTTDSLGGAGAHGADGPTTPDENGGAGGTATPPSPAVGGPDVFRSALSAVSGRDLAGGQIQGGGGGGSGWDSNLGAGGSGGGVVVVAARNVALGGSSARIAADGGAAMGIEASGLFGNGGGGGGGGGVVVVVSSVPKPAGLTLSAAGGAGGGFLVSQAGFTAWLN